MKKLSVTVQAAWISAAALLLSVLVTAAITLMQNQAPHAGDVSFAALLIKIPPGARVTIMVEGANASEQEKYQAVFTRQITHQSTLKLIESEVVSEFIRQQPSTIPNAVGSNAGRKLSALVEYIVLFDAQSAVARLVDTQSNTTLYSQTLK